MSFSILLAIMGCAPTSSELQTDETEISPTAATAMVLGGMEKNRAGFTCGVLVWTRQVKEDGFINNREVELNGEYMQWWRGEKVATTRDEEVPVQTADGTKISILKSRKVYNGVDFRSTSRPGEAKSVAIYKEPQFKAHENWMIVMGQDPKVLELLSKPWSGKAEGVTAEWILVEKGDARLLTVTTTNSSGAFAVREFDLNKGSNLVSQKWFNMNGQLSASFDYEYVHVADAGWFPAAAVTKALDPSTGKVQLHQVYKLNMEKSSFNDPSQIPDEVFEMPIVSGMKIYDYRESEKPIIYDYEVMAGGGVEDEDE